MGMHQPVDWLDYSKMAQEFFALSKNYWANTMEMMAMFQTQNEKMLNTLIENGLVSQAEGRKMLQEWLNRSKEAREDFTKTMEDNWKKAEGALGASQKMGK
jgi:polyhydroxyalkanoate synthesis regulator phasin